MAFELSDFDQFDSPDDVVMTEATQAPLAAILCAADFRVDEFMAEVGKRLRADGIRLGGAIQENAAGAAGPCSAMTLVDIGSGERIGISQDLGSQSRGCKLDARGLADMGARLDAKIDADLELLILNKFGKAEAEGGGLRSIFARAIEAGIPTLTAVKPAQSEAWLAFHGGLATTLLPRLDIVLGWCRGAVSARLQTRRPVRIRGR